MNIQASSRAHMIIGIIVMALQILNVSHLSCHVTISKQHNYCPFFP